MTFKDIQKVNEGLKSTVIEHYDEKTGKTIRKDYAEVNERIKAFRQLYPEGFITTEVISNDNGVCVIKASAGHYEGSEMRTLATGTAYEKEDSSFINKTSYIENCETSAVGRALGMLGIGIDTSVASYEEVANAIEQQKATPEQIEAIKELVPNVKGMLDYFKINKIEDMTEEQANTVIGRKKKKELENG